MELAITEERKKSDKETKPKFELKRIISSITCLNPETIRLKNIKITVGGVEKIYDIEIQWSYRDRVFKIKQLFEVVQAPTHGTVDVENAETPNLTVNSSILCDGEGVGSRELASFSASQMEISSTEGNSKALQVGEDGLPKENLKIVFKAKDLKKSVSRCVKYTNPKGFLSEYSYLCFNGNSLMATDGIVGMVHAIQINFG